MPDDFFDVTPAADAPIRPPSGPASPWTPGGRDRSTATTAAIAAGLLAVAAGVAFVIHVGPSRVLQALGRQPTTAELQERIATCQRERDWPCLEDAWTRYLKTHANDGQALANLGMALNRQDRHAQAAVQFQHAIDAGEGTYDLFAYYAGSLKQLGRVDEAIDWSYKALSVVPRLVDVRGDLARLLVSRHRPYEALSLLESFDALQQANGRGAYFEGERIAIESRLVDAAATPATGALRLPVFERHFFAPVAIGQAAPTAFLVDTGATVTSVKLQALADSHARYRVVQPVVTMLTADGRKVAAQGIVLESVRVGPYEIRDVAAVACANCEPLLGQAALARFDLQSTRTQGVEFLTLTPRSR